MTIPEKAVEWAKQIAADNSHGYDQGSRWGPDYDCSSLVITAFKQAGLPLESTYTGNMRSDFFRNGFAIAMGVNLKTGEGLRLGDVLLNEIHHTALYIGNGQIVHATGNEWGGVTGGKTGDQTGNEIKIAQYYNADWDYALRYVGDLDYNPGEKEPEKTEGGTYIVQKGDSLWRIAEKTLGAGERYIQIMSANNLTSELIYPGQVLIIPGDTTSAKTITITIRADTYDILRLMAEGRDKTIGQCIDALMEDAI